MKDSNQDDPLCLNILAVKISVLASFAANAFDGARFRSATQGTFVSSRLSRFLHKGSPAGAHVSPQMCTFRAAPMYIFGFFDGKCFDHNFVHDAI